MAAVAATNQIGRVGFDNELERVYRPVKGENVKGENVKGENVKGENVKGENDSPIPLADFADYSQIDRRLNEAASLKVECGEVILTLIRVFADPLPAIISFICELATIPAEKQATLRWATQNAEAGGVVIDPEIGAVESSGTLEVAPSETTAYTLRLSASGVDDVMKTVTVTVASPPQPNEKPIARVMRAGGVWKQGKGFSCGELRAAGLTAADAPRRSMPLDKRRRTTHRANVETIRRLTDS